jgi:AmiR/NasT family two-component response regulator
VPLKGKTRNRAPHGVEFAYQREYDPKQLAMTSVLLLSSTGRATDALIEDLTAVGIAVSGQSDCSNILQQVITLEPDLLFCVIPTPGSDFFDSLASVARSAARPVVLFTTDPDVEKMAAGAQSGIHAYIVSGYSRNRVRSVVHLAQARFRHEQVLQQELAELRTRFDERKLVDRAKGILMGARQLREEEAFRALRNAAMASKQRIGQVSNIVIESARYAEAVNRAGQLRMLSQRLVTLYALICLGVTPAATLALFNDSIGQVDTILAFLSRSLSKPTFGDLLEAVAKPWLKLQALLQRPGATAHVTEVDTLAEEVLEHAERLTANLEIAAYAPALRAINVAGRQRMLCQRVAKEALMGSLKLKPDRGAVGKRDEAQAELMEGLAYLENLPLSNAEINAELQRTIAVWEQFRHALKPRMTRQGQQSIAETSEALLAHFDRLTDMIERGIQSLIGLL